MSSWSFISHITDYLSRPRLGDQKEPTQWPSEATALSVNQHGEKVVLGKCRRAAFFRLLLDSFAYSEKYNIYQKFVEKLKQETIEVEPYLRWIWSQGELYEEHCLNLAKSAGVYISDQTPVYVSKHNVSGKIDIIVINPSTGKFNIVEIKSVYGYGGNAVLGTPAERKRGLLGKPRESHLMQIGMYQWHFANRRDEFEEGLLVYGSRDTGRTAEYKITVEELENKEGEKRNFIFYQGNHPNITEKVNSGISIENVISNYNYIAKCLDSGEIPERDFEAKYSEEKLQKLYDRGELSKKDSEQFIKRKTQLAEGKSRVVKEVVKGDWQCSYCSYRTVCYTNKEPNDLVSVV